MANDKLNERLAELSKEHSLKNYHWGKKADAKYICGCGETYPTRNEFGIHQNEAPLQQLITEQMALQREAHTKIIKECFERTFTGYGIGKNRIAHDDLATLILKEIASTSPDLDAGHLRMEREG